MSCSILEIGIYSEIHKSFLTRHVFRDTFEQDLDAVQNWSLALKGKYITAYLLQSTDIVSVLSETKQATVWVDPEDYLDKKNDKFTKAWGGVLLIKGSVAELRPLYGSELQQGLSAEMKGQEITLNNLTYSRVN